jgi:hypothetical protein
MRHCGALRPVGGASLAKEDSRPELVTILVTTDSAKSRNRLDPSMGYLFWGAPEKTQRAVTNPTLSNVADRSNWINLVLACGRGKVGITAEE